MFGALTFGYHAKNLPAFHPPLQISQGKRARLDTGFFVIRPLAFQHKNAGKILDHAQTWLGRFDRLAQNDVLKKDNILLPLQGPTQTNTKLAGAFKEVEREFAQCGLHTIRHNDTKAISAFAKQALTADGFHLTY